VDWNAQRNILLQAYPLFDWSTSGEDCY
jgi:hypothetical protein